MSVVIGVRIPKRLKEEIEKLGINYSEEIRRYLEKRVREERARRIIARIEALRKKIKPVEENFSAKLIREDRDKN